MRLGPTELILILVVVILVFGIGKLPQIGKSLGEGLKSFRKGVSGEDEEGTTEDNAEQPKAEMVEKPKEETAVKS